jgi:hypothetical protein
MATHRRPPVQGPPPELLEFRPDDWLPDVSPYWAWLMAKYEWAKTHPHDFDPLDTLRERAAYRRGVPIRD